MLDQFALQQLGLHLLRGDFSVPDHCALLHPQHRDVESLRSFLQGLPVSDIAPGDLDPHSRSSGIKIQAHMVGSVTLHPGTR